MRLKTPVVKIGSVLVGGNNPVVIQSMTNTLTADALKTANQCIELARTGAEIVRITVNDEAAAKSIPKIRQILNRRGYKHLPLVGDFHFNGHQLLTKFSECAKILDKYRVNPGNLGYGNSHDKNFTTILKIAKKYKKPIRIGVNMGSLDRELLMKNLKKNKDIRKVTIETMVESALLSAKFAEKQGLKRNQIVISVKMSDVNDTIKAYELLAEKMKKAKKIYALHLGLTEAGSGSQGIVYSTSALSILLNKGIGDTIRVSLTPENDKDRIKEVIVCKEILQSLGIRQFTPRIISCPGCGRTDNEFFQKMVKEINQYFEKNSGKLIRKYPKLKEMKIAVMGCVVNGPGESQFADIGISLPGKSEQKVAQVYAGKKLLTNLQGKNIISQFIKILEKHIR